MMEQSAEVVDLTLGKKRYRLQSSSLSFFLTLVLIGQSYYLVHLHLKPLDMAHAAIRTAIDRHDQQFQRLTEAIELLAKALMTRERTEERR